MKKLLLIIGLPGCGKTTISNHLAAHYNCPHLSTENIRASLLGLSKEQKDCDFTPDELEKVYFEISSKAHELLLDHDMVIVEGVFRNNKQREQLLSKIDKKVEVFKFLITCKESVLFVRLEERKKNGTTAPAGVEGYKIIKKSFENPGLKEDYHLLDNTSELENTIEQIVKIIGG